ncbi:hypothetical protein [Pseudomonas aeruginosa]|uniref:hypothetical protein n=1 Tax=Pseudomonas aeruginosa TaxID=287 RepID=UPI00155E0728|nr:hypothetical protein [Pseudomonas aeruginosa]NRC34005.1 hypothetical protein [Pseudomonas aeruginosa]
MSIKQVLVMNARPTDGGSAAPEIAVYPDAVELLQRVKELKALMDAHGLSEVRILSTPTWGSGDIQDELRLTCGELVVLNNGFYFTDAPAKEDYDIETDPTSINQLEEWVATGAEVIFADAGLEDAYQQFVEEQGEESDAGDQ